MKNEKTSQNVEKEVLEFQEIDIAFTYGEPGRH